METNGTMETNQTMENPADQPARQRTCASCRNWDVRIRRSAALVDSVARCLLPELAALHVTISGSGGCDRWVPVEPA